MTRSSEAAVLHENRPLYGRLSAYLSELGLERERVGLILLATGLLAVVAYRWVQFAPYAAPPGSDGGQWLAFAHYLRTGENVRAGIDVYPPLVPFLTWMLSNVVTPMAALKLIGIVASVAIAAPVYLLLRMELSPLKAAAFALVLSIAPYHSEVLSFGGYPQLLGTSLALATLFLLLYWWKTGRKLWLLLAVGTTVLGVATHVLATFAIVATAATAAVVISSRGDFRATIQRYRTALLWWALPVAVVSLPFASAYGVYLFAADRIPSNIYSLSLAQMLRWFSGSWRWEFTFWIVGAVATLAVAGYIVRRRQVSLLSAAGLRLDSDGSRRPAAISRTAVPGVR